MDAPLIALLSGLFGLFIGSLINIVSFNLPLLIIDRWRRSCYQYVIQDSHFQAIHCVSLDYPTPLAPRLLSPPCCRGCKRPLSRLSLFSLLWSQGKCPHCHRATSPLYAYTELLTSFIFMMIIASPREPVAALIIFSLTAVLIAAALIDIQHQLLPDSLTYPLLWSGLISGYFGLMPLTLSESVAGIMVGFLLLWLPAHAFRLIKGIHGLGHGDIKLMAGLGAWLGPASLPAVMLLASMGGLLFWWFNRRIGKQNNSHMAFGPFLAIAGWLALLEDPFIIDP
ncbi:prepilin peptidase [Budvicia diplopodorum]|uniref:prepilin peptidase n=1 Tax=Budvicia diplopodorum TaxID=1119056 RepID=UPI001358A06F|nr:A24 family peptidase [Budvicia diplopodorum]